MKPRFSLLFTIALPFAFATYTQAQTFNNSTADGLPWGTAGNWTPATVPNAEDAEAIVNGAGPSGTSPATLALDVLMDGNYTIGKLTRTDNGGQPATFPTTPTTGDVTKGLTLQTSVGQPQISVVGDVFFYSALFGTQGFEKTGAGRFTFRFNGMNQTYTGPVKISAGTLGIEKDRSLGDVTNGIEIADGARLFAEPGGNAGTITLPATRSITLGGTVPQIGSANANVNLVIAGNISDGINDFGIDKTDAGVVTLAGTNTWSGASAVTAGVLAATQPAALPAYATQVYAVRNASTLAVRHGDGIPSWSISEIAGLLGNGGLSFESSASFGIDTTGNITDTIYAGNLVNDFAMDRFTKVGPGKLTLSNAPDLSRITVFEGTLALGLASQPASGVALLFTKTGGTLDLGTLTVNGDSLAHVNGGTTTITNGVLGLPATASFIAGGANTTLSLPSAALTIGRVQPSSGNTTTINGAGGSLTVNGDFNFDVNGANNTRLNLSGLSSFTYDRSNRSFRSIPATATTNVTNELLLAAGTNLIKAGSVTIGGATGTSQGTAHQGQLRLGATNNFQTPAFSIGAFNGSGVVTFQAGLTNPSLKIRGSDGIAPIPLLRVGETNSGARSGAGTLDLAGGSADILATEILVARHAAGSNNADTSIINIPNGTVTATTVKLVQKASTGTPLLIGTINQTGGNVSIGSLLMVETIDGVDPNFASATQNLRANYNLTGGNLTVAEIKPGPLATPITAGTTQRNLVLLGGTLTNPTGADLAISGITVTVSGVTTTTVDSTVGQKIVLASNVTYSARMNSSTPSAGTLTVDGDLDLSALPVFSIFDDAPVDATLLPAGTELVLIDYQNGSLTGSFTGLADGDTISVTKGAVTNQFVVDYTDPDYGGKAVTLTVPLGGGSFASWANDPLKGNIPGEPASGDFDNDGLTNLVEYALGKNPRVSSQPAGVLTGNKITFTKGSDAITNGDVSWVIETSTTLDAGSWSPQVTQTPGDLSDFIEYDFTPPTPAKNFARLKVTQVP